MTEQNATSGAQLPPVEIREDLSYDYRSVDVLGSKMSYFEDGEGENVLLIHGNPTSAYLWRNIVPNVADAHRAIAVDLIGMGRSEKPDIGYKFADHYRYFEGFIEALGLEDVTLVGHDWGATLAWEYARRNPDRVRRLAFMEGVLPPTFPKPSYESMGEELGNMFRSFNDAVKGPELVVEANMFVEQVFPGFVNRPLGEKAMSVYRAPFVDKADRQLTLTWPREIPIAGDPPSNVEMLNEIAGFMGTTEMPVLFVYVDPGVVAPPEVVGWYTERISNVETAYVGRGLHFFQEDHPEATGRALADWMRRN